MKLPAASCGKYDPKKDLRHTNNEVMVICSLKKESTLRYKSFQLLCKYHLRSFSRFTVTKGIAYLLFLISCFLFCIIIFPTFRQRLVSSQFLSQAPRTLTLTGITYSNVINRHGAVYRLPQQGVIVESGGFRTVSDSKGIYTLCFVSKSQDDIPIIAHIGSTQILIRVSFPKTENRLTKNVVIR